MSSSDESSTHTPRKRRRLSEVSTPSNTSQEESGHEDDMLEFDLEGHVASLLPSSSEHEEGANVEEVSSDSEENCSQTEEELLLPFRDNAEVNLFVEDQLNEDFELLGNDDSDPVERIPDNLGEDSLINTSFIAYNESKVIDFEDEKSLQGSQLSNNDANEKFCDKSCNLSVNSDPFEQGAFDYSQSDLVLNSLPPLEDETKDTSLISEENIQKGLNSSAHDQTLLATDQLDTSVEDPSYSSTPLKEYPTSTATCSRVIPTNIEALFLSPSNLNMNASSSDNDNESSSDNNSDHEETHSDSEKQSSDSGSEAEEEQHDLSQYSESNNVLEIGELDESTENIRSADNALSKAILFSELQLYPSPLCHLSVLEGILDIMNLYLKNKLSKNGLQRLIETTCKFLPTNHNLPTSSYQILTFVQSLAPPVPAVKHFYCKSCFHYHGESNVGECAICKVSTNFGHFYIFDVAALLIFFFEHRNLADLMDSEARKRSNRDPKLLTDLKDGSVYQSLNKNRARYDVNLSLSADGLRVRKGGKSELWLAMISIVELPINLQRSFLTVVGVWYHSVKPDMRVFLKPFAESLHYLDLNGVEWTHPTTGEVHKSCVRLPVTILDAPARAMVQNIKAFNSKYGCNICEIKLQKSVHVPGRKAVRVYHYVPNPPLRTKERMLHQAETAVLENKKSVKGVKGPSVLSIIPSVDISKCIVPEYLHSVLIGVVRQLVVIWCSKPGPWSIKHRISEIDAFLATFKHPSFVHRSVRQLKNFKSWKASDYYYFLLFEAVPALQGHLPDPYLQHFMLLVKSIYTFLKSSTMQAERKDADSLLQLFVIQFMSLYGDRQLTHNVHQLCHLAACVELYGPLFCFSAFSSEDLNGTVSNTTHGTVNVDAEIVNNIKTCQGVIMLQNIVRGLHGLNVPYDSSFSEGEFLGDVVSGTLLSPEELAVLPNANSIFYARAKLGYDDFTSEIYKVVNSVNYNVMWNHQGKQEYGSIKYFAKCGTENFVVIRLFDVDHTKVFYHARTLKCIEQFIPVIVSNRFIAKKFSDLASNIVKVGKIGCYVYVRPHLYRFVL